MRFIGNKANIVSIIYKTLCDKEVKGNSFFDFFSGTVSVGKFYKKLGYQIFSSDLLYFSYVLQKAYIENNEIPKFKSLLPYINNDSFKLFQYPLDIVISHLNNLSPVEGFIFRNFTFEGTSELETPRLYFTGINGKKIDAIRIEIENWKNNNLISEFEYYILLTCLIESVPFYSNISGVYAAFRKSWDPRALKPFKLRPIEIIINDFDNFSYNINSLNLLDMISCDILYLDPPYNQRQYAPNYHLLETVAKYDNPVVKGVAGLRSYENQKSNFCNPYTAIEELNYIAENANYKYLVLSYNSEGIMPSTEIEYIFKKNGDFNFFEFDNLRYKSNSNGESQNKKFIKEQLYILKKILKNIPIYTDTVSDKPLYSEKIKKDTSKSFKSNLWLLTEERPKSDVLKVIIAKFFKLKGFAGFIDNLRILPILENGKFTFTYEVSGIRCNQIDKVLIVIVSGYSSFVDYLVFFQENQPDENDIPVLAVEETKTDDKESRNTGVYQRASKFVYIEYFFPRVKKLMLYNLQIEQKESPTDTYIFGTKLLLNLSVEIIGKQLEKNVFNKFKSIDELIDFKSNMRKAPKGNVPINIKKLKNRIEISGRLIKNNRLAHDPNIGSITLICAVLRKLGWNKDIVITNHGLNKKHIGKRNKFIKIANLLNIQLKDLKIPDCKFEKSYWKYETKGEKLGTIFIHLVVENFTDGYSIFENHAGCEKGYFITKDGEPIALEKYKDRKAYKEGDKGAIIHIPDLILIDFGKMEIINVEGKKYQFRKEGIKELKNYTTIEKDYIKKYYPEFDIIRTVVLYGSRERKLIEIQIGFLLNEDGDLILGIKAPSLFVKAIKNLIEFWGL